MMRLAILGASGHGKVVADAAEASGWGSITFFDDAWPKITKNGPWDVQGDTSDLMANIAIYDGVVVGIGDNSIRAEKQAQLMIANAKIVTIIHPSAVVSVHAKVGVGSVIFPNAVINACSTVGAGVIVNSGSVVEHDCTVGDFAHISPGAVLAGGVELSRLVWIGACASVRQLLRVGEASVVGMGAAVTKSVPAGVVVAGNPAKILKS